MAHGSPNENVCRIYRHASTVHSDYFSGVSITAQAVAGREVPRPV
jgi:hypothetical protein